MVLDRQEEGSQQHCFLFSQISPQAPATDAAVAKALLRYAMLSQLVAESPRRGGIRAKAG